MSIDIHDIITCATFCDDRLRCFGEARGRISRFPIDLRRRPYNTRTTVRVCETVNYVTLVFICIISRYTDGLMVSVGSVVGGPDSFSHRKEHSREERQALSAKPDQNELVSGADP